MVTSGHSQVHILDGVHVVSNYKGLRSSCQAAASFTSDGDHIISASDDSSIYMWNYANQIAPVTSRLKTIWSYERFFCNDVSVAIPWNASPAKRSISLALNIPSLRQQVSDEIHNLQESTSYCHAEDSLGGDSLHQLPSGNFTLSSTFFAESMPRGTATWPEEQLPSNSVAPSSTLRKSQYKFLKTSCQRASTHSWGQVIVTASWDGHIRSFQNYGLPVQVWHGARHASLHNCLISGYPRDGSWEVHCKTFMPQEALLAEVDARPDHDYTVQKSHMFGCLYWFACGPEVVCSPVVLQDLDSIVTLWEARRRWIASQTKLCAMSGVRAEIAMLWCFSFSLFLLPPGSFVNI